MDSDSMKMMVEGACPFAQKHGMRTVEFTDEGRLSMLLSDIPDNLNAFGLVHAGAICGLVETAGGMALFKYLDPMEDVVLNTILDIRFYAMPRGELTCTTTVTPEEMGVVRGELEQSDKADKTLDLKVRDSAGQIVAQAQATFRLMHTPERFKEYFSQMAG
jgi:acyl-coenzyme A thioesterase PaaI-like protein